MRIVPHGSMMMHVVCSMIEYAECLDTSRVTELSTERTIMRDRTDMPPHMHRLRSTCDLVEGRESVARSTAEAWGRSIGS